MQQLRFVKMHGLGNDFVLINGFHHPVKFSEPTIKQLSHRHCGIGFDQLLLIEKSLIADFACRIFNSDGSEAEQCGNGMRCVARFVQEEHLTDKKSFHIETKAGIIAVNIHNYDNIEVNMGIPSFEPETIPFVAKNFQPLYPIHIPNMGTMEIAVVSMGNPHAIFFVDSIKHFPIHDVGSIVTKHDLFPHGVNVGFVEVLNRKRIRLRTFERGVGETLACGSNACAAVVTGIMNQQLDHNVTVELALGELVIQWEGDHHPVMMSGPASRVFNGVMPYNA